MRDGPSDSDCRVRVETTGSGVGPTAGVVSVFGKAARTRQVRAGKANVSNVSKALGTSSKPDSCCWSGDTARGVPVDCSSDDGHKGWREPRSESWKFFR